jgi:hypothetical protein
MSLTKLNNALLKSKPLSTCSGSELTLLRGVFHVRAHALLKLTTYSGVATALVCALLLSGQTYSAVELRIAAVTNLATLEHVMSALFVLTMGLALALGACLHKVRLCTPLSATPSDLAHANELCAKSSSVRDIRNRAVEAGRELHELDYRAMQKAIRRPSLVTAFARSVLSRG